LGNQLKVAQTPRFRRHVGVKLALPWAMLASPLQKQA
jgi:hypothetical protein